MEKKGLEELVMIRNKPKYLFSPKNILYTNSLVSSNTPERNFSSLKRV